MALYRGMAAAARGHFATALQYFDLALAATTQQSGAARHAVLAHRAMLWAQVGQRSRALTDAAVVIQQPHLPPWVTARAQHAMALTSTNDHDLAGGLLQAEQPLDDRDQLALDGPVRLHLALLAAQVAMVANPAWPPPPAHRTTSAAPGAARWPRRPALGRALDGCPGGCGRWPGRSRLAPCPGLRRAPPRAGSAVTGRRRLVAWPLAGLAGSGRPGPRRPGPRGRAGLDGPHP